MATLADAKGELARTKRQLWTFIVFLMDGRAITSPKRRLSQKAIEQYLARRLREIERVATPESICRTGREDYLFAHWALGPAAG
jgi:hypothetical protein